LNAEVNANLDRLRHVADKVRAELIREGDFDSRLKQVVDGIPEEAQY